jgi:hypothetical protein
MSIPKDSKISFVGALGKILAESPYDKNFRLSITLYTADDPNGKDVYHLKMVRNGNHVSMSIECYEWINKVKRESALVSSLVVPGIEFAQALEGSINAPQLLALQKIPQLHGVSFLNVIGSNEIIIDSYNRADFRMRTSVRESFDEKLGYLPEFVLSFVDDAGEFPREVPLERRMCLDAIANGQSLMREVLVNPIAYGMREEDCAAVYASIQAHVPKLRSAIEEKILTKQIGIESLSTKGSGAKKGPRL